MAMMASQGCWTWWPVTGEGSKRGPCSKPPHSCKPRVWSLSWGDPLWSHPRGQAVLAAPQSESVPYPRRVVQTVWVPLIGCGAHAWTVVL